MNSRRAAAASDGQSDATSADETAGTAARSSWLRVLERWEEDENEEVGASAAAAATATPYRPYSLFDNVVAGAGAGVVGDTLMHPFDTVSTRMKSSAESVSMISTFSRVLRTDGIRGLYAGLTATLAAAVPSNAIYFGTYETCKAMGEARVDPSYFPLVHFAAGAASDLVSSLVYVPMEVVKCRLQLGRDPAAWTSGVVTAAQPYRGTAHALGTIFRREGLRGLYAGFGACIVTDCAYSAAQFLVYEQLKALFRRRARRDGGEPRLTTPAVLAAGAGAGAVAAAITNPLDVITTRLMIQRQQGQQEADTSRRVRFPGYDSPVERRPLARAGPAQGPGLHTATPRVRALPRHGTPAGVASLLRVLDGALVRATRVPGQQGAYDPSSATPPRVTGLSRRLRAARSAAVPEAVAARRAAPGLPAPGSRAVVHYAGLWHGLRMIVRHSGWHGLWRGTVPRVVSIMPLSAIAFGVFENVRAYVYDSRTHRGVAAG